MAAQPYLDPLNQGLADAVATMPGVETLSPAEFRDSLVQLNAHENLPGVDRNVIQIPVANGTETWIYTPTGARGPLPYIFYVHGGGFIGGNISTYDPIATDLVLRTGYALVFPEYKLAPEAKWPAQQEQCFEVLEWTIENGVSHNLIPDKFAIVGDSVGAQQKSLNIPYNILLNPMASLDYDDDDDDAAGDACPPTSSRRQFWNGPYLTGAALRWFVDGYVPASSSSSSVDRRRASSSSELTNPVTHASAATIGAFAPTLIVTGSADILRDEGEALGERLQRAGRDVAVLRAHGQLHDAPALVPTRDGPTPKMVMTLMAAALKERLG